jgi:hypothetical protein
MVGLDSDLLLGEHPATKTNEMRDKTKAEKKRFLSTNIKFLLVVFDALPIYE